MSIIICPECGKEMSDAAISCPNCGKPNTDIAQNKPKPNTDISQNKRHIGFWLGAGIVLFPIIFSWFTLRKGHSTKAKVIAFSWLALYLVFYSGSKHDLQQKTSPSSQISSSAVQETSTVSDGTTYKIGETFQVGYTSYSVWNAQWRKRLSDNQFLDQAPDANWLFV